MAKNHTTKNSTITTSEKVKNGFLTSPFRSIFRNSNHHSNIDPIPPVSQSSGPAAGRAASSGKKDKTTRFQLGAEGQVKPRAGTDLGAENWTSKNGVNNECSEYINRVKNNMGNGSNHDNIERTATKVSRRDSFNDKVSSFLNRARIKMRTPSSNIGDVNSISFNRRANDR